MAITYVTRVAVPSRAAQAGQIHAMSRAFHRVLEGRFRLVSAPGEEGRSVERDYAWHGIRPAGRGVARHAQFCLAALRSLRADPAGVIFTRDIAVAIVVTAAGGRAVYEAHKAPAGRLARGLTRVLARSPRSRIVAISAALAGHYVRHEGFPADRVLAAHDGVFPEAYGAPPAAEERRALRRELGLPEHDFLVVHTGSLYKGGAELFEHVARAGVPATTVVQVGGTADEQSRWAAHYAGLGIANVRFVPHVPMEVARRYQACADVLFYMNTRASPIHWCTSPLKLFEYMATGIPILGAAIGSVREVIDERNAFCFDPDEPASIAAALAAIHRDPSEAARRAARAREAALGEYSWYRRAERIARFAAATPGGVR